MLAALLYLWIRQIGFLQFGISGRMLRPIISRAVPFIVVAFLGWLSGYGNNFLIAHFFPRTEVARFTFALSVCSIMILIAGALNQTWSPRFYGLIHELPFAGLERRNKQFYRILGLSLGVAAGLGILLFPVAIRLLGGNLVWYGSMKLELALLFASYVVLTPWWQCQNHFLAHGLGHDILVITLLTSVPGIVALLLLMRFVGPIGIYIGFLIQMVFRGSGIVLVAQRKWPVDVSWIGIIGGLLAIVLGFGLSSLLESSPLSVVLYVVCVGLLVGLYFRADWAKVVAQ